MCGIAGIIDYHNTSSEVILQNMIKDIHHRGPDDCGYIFLSNNYCNIGFGHTRLSIIDTSSAGHQPMCFQNYIIIFNGEIYNYKEIKKDLSELGHSFLTNSDTEVILHSYYRWGFDCVKRFVGMFAFAIYDKSSNEIILFRDRAGIKPLYYYWHDGLFLFGSELKIFHNHPKFIKKIDEQSVNLYFKYGYVPSPYSIYEKTKKLDQGNYLVFNLNKKNITINKYWNVLDSYMKPTLNISYNDAKIEIEKLLISACNYRMVSDVPVGVFLSGGYDSTAVTALLQKDRTDKIKTFTIGFNEGNNEAPYAKETANFLGTDHTEYYCEIIEAKKLIPMLTFHYDEPFADVSSIPTMLVSKLAKQKVSVALSADAGDEIFAGYNSYVSFQRNLKILKSTPEFSEYLLKKILKILSRLIRNDQSFTKIKIQGLIKTFEYYKNYRESFLFDLMQGYPINLLDKLINFSVPILYNNLIDINSINSDLNIGLAMDYRNYLQNNILTKVDRATMAFSLEGREPLLDHRLIEFVSQLPTIYKYDGITTKKIFKDIVHNYVPKSMMNRPKTGFNLPIYTWLRGDLSFLINENMNKKDLELSGLLNTKYINRIIQLFYAKRIHDESIIWKILQFQMWYKHWT